MKKYTHYQTGATGTRGDFIHEITREELDCEGFDNSDDLFDSYVARGIFIEVE